MIHTFHALSKSLEREKRTPGPSPQRTIPLVLRSILLLRRTLAGVLEQVCSRTPAGRRQPPRRILAPGWEGRHSFQPRTPPHLDTPSHLGVTSEHTCSRTPAKTPAGRRLRHPGGTPGGWGTPAGRVTPAPRRILAHRVTSFPPRRSETEGGTSVPRSRREGQMRREGHPPLPPPPLHRPPQRSCRERRHSTATGQVLSDSLINTNPLAPTMKRHQLSDSTRRRLVRLSDSLIQRSCRERRYSTASGQVSARRPQLNIRLVRSTLIH